MTMKTGVLLLVLLALSAAARPADGLDVCAMKSEEVSAAEIDRYTRIYVPLGRDMTCSELLSLTPENMEMITKCFYVKDTLYRGWHNDVRWAHVRAKCERLLGSTPAEEAPLPKEDTPRCGYCQKLSSSSTAQKVRVLNPYAEGGPCYCEYYAWDTRGWDFFTPRDTDLN